MSYWRVAKGGHMGDPVIRDNACSSRERNLCNKSACRCKYLLRIVFKSHHWKLLADLGIGFQIQLSWKIVGFQESHLGWCRYFTLRDMNPTPQGCSVECLPLCFKLLSVYIENYRDFKGYLFLKFIVSRDIRKM